MSTLTIIAKLVVRDDAVQSVKAELLKMIEPTREEAGCIEYRLHQENTNPAVFIFYETWRDTESFEQHTETPHFKNYVAAVSDAVIDKALHKLTRLA